MYLWYYGIVFSIVSEVMDGMKGFSGEFLVGLMHIHVTIMHVQVHNEESCGQQFP